MAELAYCFKNNLKLKTLFLNFNQNDLDDDSLEPLATMLDNNDLVASLTIMIKTDETKFDLKSVYKLLN